MLSDHCPVLSVCLSCLSVTLVYCGKMVGWIKIKLGMGVGLNPSHIVLDLPRKEHNLQFLAHVCCGQTARWIKMPLGTKVGLSPGQIMLDGDPTPSPQKGAQPPNFGPVSIVAKRSPISATAEHLFILTMIRWDFSEAVN